MDLPSPVFLPGDFQGQRNLVGYSTWGHKESDITEQWTLSLFTYLHSYLQGKDVNFEQYT